MSVEAPEVITEDKAPAEPATASLEQEIDRLDPPPAHITLKSGLVLNVEPLRSRQLFRLLKILTKGSSTALMSAAMTGVDDEQFATTLVTLAIFSIPDAEDETIDFVKSMVSVPGVSKRDAKASAEAFITIEDELDNPELEDLITLVENIIRRESKDLRALGNRLRAAFPALAPAPTPSPATSTPATTTS